jgi:hypothetical protein
MIKVLKKSMDDLNKEKKIVKRRIYKRSASSRVKVSNENIFRSLSTISNTNTFVKSDTTVNSLVFSIEQRLEWANEFFHHKLSTYDSEMEQSRCEKPNKSKQLKIVYKKVKTFPSEKEIVLEWFWKKYSQHSLKNGKTLYYKCKIDEHYCTKKSQVVFNKFTNEIEYYEADEGHKHLCEIIKNLKSAFAIGLESESRQNLLACPTTSHTHSYVLTEMYNNDDSPYLEEDDEDDVDDSEEAIGLDSNEFNANSTSENFDSLNEDLECAYYSEQPTVPPPANEQMVVLDDKCNNPSYYLTNDSPVNMVESHEYYANSNFNGNYYCSSINSEGFSMNSSDYYDTSLLENLDCTNEMQYEQNSYSVGSSENPWSCKEGNDEIPSIASFTSDILSNNSSNISVYDYDLSKVSNETSTGTSLVYMNSEGRSSESNCLNFFLRFFATFCQKMIKISNKNIRFLSISRTLNQS